MAGLEVRAGATTAKPEPDFHISSGSSQARVEVFSKQMDDVEADELRVFRRELLEFPANRRWANKEHWVTPFGKPKPYELVTENVINRVAAIKQDDRQLSDSETSILWLDFQDETWQLVMRADAAVPISTWNGELFSGGIWYAHYGWKGAPIFEGHSGESGLSSHVQPMQHDGRFRRGTKADLVFISLPKGTIALENPESSKLASNPPWDRMIDLPWFALEMSWCDWPARNLSARIDLERATIESFRGSNGGEPVKR